jgi:DNA-binding HxlR family transcriptional regulator
MKNKNTVNELKIFGDYWNLRIIRALSTGSKRFCQIEKDLDDINPTTLTTRLKKLEYQKIIIRTKENLNQIAVVYSLTDKGLAIIPILYQMRLYAEKFL